MKTSSGGITYIYSIFVLSSIELKRPKMFSSTYSGSGTPRRSDGKSPQVSDS